MDIIKVLIADDQRLMREGLATLLALADDIDIVAQAGDGAEAIELAQARRPDVILMDIQMPRVNGVEATRTIRSILPATQIIILTTFDNDEYLLEGLRAGACGYLLKDMPSEQLADAIRSAAKGQSPIGPEMARKLVNLVTQNPIVPLSPTAGELSEREIEVLRLIADGLSNKEIAEKLFIAEGTAKNHVSNILSKLEARDRAQAVARAKELNLL
ncbi:MAG TPA: response regulator transcription factor [Anaerolineae bacterium]|nr:response regulator transcription factor [Anaerolineae bacterium]